MSAPVFFVVADVMRSETSVPGKTHRWCDEEAGAKSALNRNVSLCSAKMEWNRLF
jgi:hypothetical protein